MKILLFHAHSGDPLSFLIKAMTRSPYCHAAVLVDSPEARKSMLPLLKLGSPGEDRLLIIEAYYPHVRARFLEQGELAEIDVVEIAGVTPQVESAAYSWALACIDKQVDYGITDLFRFTAPGRVVLGENDDQSYQKHTICSQFAFNVFRMGGIRLLNAHDYEVSPDKLLWSPFCTLKGKLSEYSRPLPHTTNEHEQANESAQPTDLPGSLAAGPSGSDNRQSGLDYDKEAR